MKSSLLIFVGIIPVILLLTVCEKDSGNGSQNTELTYLKTLAGGCNEKEFNEIVPGTDQDNDTVIISISDDTLDIYVGLNYICCAPFAPEATISNDSILAAVRDTCSNPYQTCYCRCMCYYTWNFLFVDFENIVYNFKIELYDPREENPVILKEGTIDLTNID